MSKIPFDLSGFQKISANDKKTTLRHKKGHFFVLAHGVLDEPTRKALDALPFAKGGKVKKDTYKEQPASKDPGKPRAGVRPRDLFPEKYPKQPEEPRQENPKLEESKKEPTTFAEGGEAKREKEIAFDEAEAEPATAGQETSPPATPDEPAQQSSAPDSQPIIEPVAQGTPSPEAPQATEAPQPDASTSDSAEASDTAVPGGDATLEGTDEKSPDFSGPSIAQDVLQERNNIAQDLMTGQIHPRTYSDLYASKSTLGKIGTIFGLALSGLGSGLSGQPNALLHMMDKTIERDLEAQKQSATNRQNYYKIAQQQVITDATAKKLAADTGLTLAQAKDAVNKAAMSGISLDLMRQSVGLPSKLSPAEELQTHTQAKHAMEVSALHHLDQQNQKLPPGSPIHQAANAALSAYAQKKLTQDQPAEAQKVQDAYDAEKVEPIDTNILVPGWQQKVALAAKYHPLLQDQAPELHKQAQTAQQAEKAMQVVNEIFPKMQSTASVRGRLARGGSGALTSIGAGIGTAIAGAKGAGAGAGVGKAFHDLAAVGDEPTKQYEAYKSTLVNSIKTLIPGLTEEEVRNFIDSNAPEQGDDPKTVAIKQRNILEKIKNSAPHNLLDTAGVYKQ